MTRKDYILLAKAINNTWLDDNSHCQTCEALALELMDMLKNDNSFFDKDKFHSACFKPRYE